MRKAQTVQPSIREVLIKELKQHAKCTKMKNARAKCAKLLFFICQIRKFVVFLLTFLSWLFKLLVSETTTSGVSRLRSCVTRHLSREIKLETLGITLVLDVLDVLDWAAGTKMISRKHYFRCSAVGSTQLLSFQSYFRHC